MKELQEKQFARKNCTVVAMACKFQQLYCTSEPTGDPNIPLVVKWALNIREIMREKADGMTGSFCKDEKEEDDDIFTDGLMEEKEEEVSTYYRSSYTLIGDNTLTKLLGVIQPCTQ